ncbi:hypothetical protein ACQR2B_32480 [Bradyrhizobium oligotrophicum]|uniref:hypothetical protein n=1 Tax=Bradyrhizobium TaxID=374 RepID=UPI003EBAD4DF
MTTTRDRVEQYVLDYFHRQWPSATEATSLAGDLGLDAYEIYLDPLHLVLAHKSNLAGATQRIGDEL